MTLSKPARGPNDTIQETVELPTIVITDSKAKQLVKKAEKLDAKADSLEAEADKLEAEARKRQTEVDSKKEDK